MINLRNNIENINIFYNCYYIKDILIYKKSVYMYIYTYFNLCV